MIKECVIKDIFLILVIASVNVINHVILVNIQIIQIVSVKKIIDPLIEECAENDDDDGKTKIVNITVENDDKTKIANVTVESKNSSCKVYIIFMLIAPTTLTGNTIYFVYYNWFLIKNKVLCTKSNTHKETLIY